MKSKQTAAGIKNKNSDNINKICNDDKKIVCYN